MAAFVVSVQVHDTIMISLTARYPILLGAFV
jgi:hypothetical protein